MTKCPKCGKEAWVVTVERKSLKGLDRVTYRYRAYRHYAGSKKTITLKALGQLLNTQKYANIIDAVHIMEEAKKRAGSKVVTHYERLPTA